MILSKDHLSSGGTFTISRNDTRVIDIGVDGALSLMGNVSVSGCLVQPPSCLESQLQGKFTSLETTVGRQSQGSSWWTSASNGVTYLDLNTVNANLEGFMGRSARQPSTRVERPQLSQEQLSQSKAKLEILTCINTHRCGSSSGP